jgi:hypothetical protein
MAKLEMRVQGRNMRIQVNCLRIVTETERGVTTRKKTNEFNIPRK